LSSQHPTPPPDPYSLSLHDALPISIILSTHDVGGARAGDDPENSVLDKHLLTHEIPNLAVLGGAGFASVAGYNPTETIEAYAWYASEYMAENFDEITSKEAEKVATPAD